MFFSAPNLVRVQEPRGLVLIEKVTLKKWRAFRPVLCTFGCVGNQAEYRKTNMDPKITPTKIAGVPFWPARA